MFALNWTRQATVFFTQADSLTTSAVLTISYNPDWIYGYQKWSLKINVLHKILSTPFSLIQECPDSFSFVLWKLKCYSNPLFKPMHGSHMHKKCSYAVYSTQGFLRVVIVLCFWHSMKGFVCFVSLNWSEVWSHPPLQASELRGTWRPSTIIISSLAKNILPAA